MSMCLIKMTRKYIVFLYILGVVKDYLVKLPLHFPYPPKVLN